ncbi:two-component sensor histidine kinase [Actinosynnema sp. ALI-1.44]|uniref:sensor histidine kinase n=1 Tax=Actinosynnema sp. ALI-1.44 TaxID=1933779 RepID=UPI00097C5CC3|nr:HAMP domain-containing sensor histidine kinase [Actinosynnema sp. ALI-1.44]ONI86915.1 two-component sensor histidine kinase [Actinosynnema sp. ALI-1.44]
MRKRRSLVVRLITVSVLIAVGAIAATTWLAVRTTTNAIQQDQGQALAGDATIYRELVRFAAMSTDWQHVDSFAGHLASATGRHIVLTTPDRRTIADTGGPRTPLPAEPAAVVDPLHTDLPLVPEAAPSGIHPLAVGPFRLTDTEYVGQQDLATQRSYCLHDNGFAATVHELPNRRIQVEPAGGSKESVPPWKCDLIPVDRATPTEEQAIARLTTKVNECLSSQGMPPVKVSLDYTTTSVGGSAQVADACVNSSRRDLLRPYVAPAVFLFVSSPSGAPATPGFELSGDNVTRIVTLAVVVLALTVLLTVLTATRLTRPLRVLTEAAQHNRRAAVRSNDEIGYLAAAFNDLSERREITEEQRKRMVGDIAHELRNPLTAMRGQLEAAQDGHLPTDEELTASLLEETVLLQHIVDDLQMLATVDAGELRLHPEPVRVADLLGLVVGTHRDQAAAADVRVAVRVHGDPELVADPVRIRQVVANLLSNAIRHTPPGGCVTVRTWTALDDVVIEVSDTGSGISATDLPHVFDRFWRADKSRSRQTGGSGLGLAIVRQLAHAHNGTVTAASPPGEGATFTLRLPQSS